MKNMIHHCCSVKKSADVVYDEIAVEYLQIISNESHNENISLEISQSNANGSEGVYDNEPPN